MGHGLRGHALALPFAAGQNWHISQTFDDARYKDGYALGGHEGIDWGCCEGTPIHAMAAGRVSAVVPDQVRGGLTDDDYDAVYGNQVRIRTGNGSLGFEHTYTHLAQVYVYAGQEVAQGQLLGLAGNTGRSTNPHLHAHLSPFGLTAVTAANPHGLLRGLAGTQPVDPTVAARLVGKTNTEKTAAYSKTPLRVIGGTVDFARFLPPRADRPPRRNTTSCLKVRVKATASETDRTLKTAPLNGAESLEVASPTEDNPDATKLVQATQGMAYALMGKDAATNPQWRQISVPDQDVSRIRRASADSTAHLDLAPVPDAHPRVASPLCVFSSAAHTLMSSDVPSLTRARNRHLTGT